MQDLEIEEIILVLQSRISNFQAVLSSGYILTELNKKNLDENYALRIEECITIIREKLAKL